MASDQEIAEIKAQIKAALAERLTEHRVSPALRDYRAEEQARRDLTAKLRSERLARETQAAK